MEPRRPQLDDSYIKVDDVYIYKFTAAPNDYTPNEGYPIKEQSNAEVDINNLLLSMGTMALDYGSKTMIAYLSMHHKDHHRMVNYSDVIMAEKIKGIKQKEKEYNTLIEERLGKAYWVKDIKHTYHIKHENKTEANVWIVSLQTPDDSKASNSVDKGISLLCFSEYDAQQAAYNINQIIITTGKEIFNYDFISKIISNTLLEGPENNLLLIAERHLKIAEASILNMLLADTDLNNRLLELSDNASLANRKKLARTLRKYILTDIANNTSPSQKPFHALVFNFMQAHMDLIVRQKEHYLHHKEISAQSESTHKTQQDLLTSVNAYVKKPLEVYINNRMNKIDSYCFKKRLSTLDTIKLKQFFLQDVKNADLSSIYTNYTNKKNKNESFFGQDVDYAFVKQLMHSRLKTNDISSYIDNKISKMHTTPKKG